MKFNKYPTVKISQEQDWCVLGWDKVCSEIEQAIKKIKTPNKVILLECYQGVYIDEIKNALSTYLKEIDILLTSDYLKTEEEIRELTQPDVTDDRVFGVITNLQINDFFSQEKLQNAQETINKSSKPIIILGTGASLFSQDPALIIYADMTRWEIQQRMRKNLVDNIGISDRNDAIEKQYKRAYFVDWRVCDNLKKEQINNWNFVLDTTIPNQPKFTTGDAVRWILDRTTKQPFSVVPFFDAGPWGGQWMKEKFDLDKSMDNFAWCFNCVPEENSLLIEYSNTNFEIPSLNSVFYKPKELLGQHVFNEFGAEFPIRFDFLDTMEGGNLSLQVHPLKEYIKDQFGMAYTQDESYYMLDVGEDAFVYLGINENVNKEDMILDLKKSQLNGHIFNADKYSKKWPAKKHDHFLIPAGTVHCSGSGCMVLEISATPYIFTFKLWDWGRLGMDGRPRPISIEHGEKVIDWDRTPNWTEDNLINQFEKVNSGEGWMEEKTGLHELEFIETRRQWFNTRTLHNTNDTVNVLMLIEGEEALVESPTNAFEPFLVNYAEAFIVPAQVGAYTIKPSGESLGKEIATIKAFVRSKS
jgi:mannose-6-phosphate isomerase class I